MFLWLHNSLIELIWEIRKGELKVSWNPLAAGPFFTCLMEEGKPKHEHCTETSGAFVLMCVYAPVCVCVCLHSPWTDTLAPHTHRSAGVWLIWAEVVVTSWTGTDFLSSPNTDLVFIINSVSCLYVFIDQRCYGWWYEGRGDGSGSERRKSNDRKKKEKKNESETGESAAFPLRLCVSRT